MEYHLGREQGDHRLHCGCNSCAAGEYSDAVSDHERAHCAVECGYEGAADHERAHEAPGGGGFADKWRQESLRCLAHGVAKRAKEESQACMRMTTIRIVLRLACRC
jgi:hypothetical protein